MDQAFYFPCPICKKLILIEATKNSKPYLKCNDCGVQLFVRGKDGIKRFTALVGKARPKSDSQNLLNTLDYFNALKTRLDEIESDMPILGRNEDLEIEAKIIRGQLDNLRQQLKKIDSE